jgi:hypothetical protein
LNNKKEDEMKLILLLVVFMPLAAVYGESNTTGNLSKAAQAVENRSYVRESANTASSGKNQLTGSSSFSKDNVSLDTKKSYYEYGTDKNRADKQYTDITD